MSKTVFFKEAMREYDRLKFESEARLSARKDELYLKCPRIKEIDSELALLSIEAAKNAFSPSEAASAAKSKIKERSAILLKERSKLYKENGVDENYFNSVYKCPDCKDTGFKGNETCVCLRQVLIKKYYSGANLSAAFKNENFDTFDLKYYSEVTDEKHGISPNANIRIIWMRCLTFVEEFEQNPSNLLFYGTSGLGKTFLCNCIAKEILERNHTVFYSTSSALFKTIQELRFGKNEYDEREDFIAMLTAVDLLIIDDLGTELMTSVTGSEFFNIINTRLLYSRPTIISTNLNNTELMEHYSDRISSRIIGNYTLLKFFGDDIRLKKKYGT